jgi:hypothetical protein
MAVSKLNVKNLKVKNKLVEGTYLRTFFLKENLMKTVTLKSILNAKLDNKEQQHFIHLFGASANVPLAVWCKSYDRIAIPLYYITSQDCFPSFMEDQLRELSVNLAERVLPIVEHYYPQFSIFRELIANYRSGKKDRDLILKASIARLEIKKLEEEKSPLMCYYLAPFHAANAIVTAIATPGEIMRSYYQHAHEFVLQATSVFSKDFKAFEGRYADQKFEESLVKTQFCALIDKWTLEGFEDYEKEVIKVHNYRELDYLEGLIRSWTLISHTVEEANYHELIRQIQGLKNPNALTKFINPLVINSTVNYKKLLEVVVPYYKDQEQKHSKEHL